MSQNPMEWRSILETLEKDVQPPEVAGELPGMIEWAGGEEDGIAALVGFIAEFQVISAGLAGAYVLPPEDPTEALAVLAEHLGHLDFETGLKELPEDQARRVEKFIEDARPFYRDLGRIMQVVLGAYVRGDYDLNADPNALVLEAERLMPTNPDGALALLGRAGAMGLRGVRWWWRWENETSAPLSQWTGLALHLINDLTAEGTEPLGPAAEERTHWHALNAKVMEQETEDMPASEPDEVEKKAEDQVDKLLEQLYQGEKALTKSVEKAFEAQREQVIPSLIELVQDEDLWPVDSLGQGWVPIHAVSLLGKLHAVEAVPTLIDVIAESEWDEIIVDYARAALEEIGSPAAPALLETVRYTRDSTLKANLASLLGKVGKEDPGTFEALVRLWNELSWDQERIFVAWGFGALGEARAIPILEPALHDPKTPDFDIPEIEAVLEQLGARPAPSRGPWQLSVKKKITAPVRPQADKSRPGRNDPCWCGSGKKYKHCHLEADERAPSTG